MPLASIGALLPRDFLERQPKRWQKSQRKRRVLGTLRKMKAKREKLEQNTIAKAKRDAGIVVGKPDKQSPASASEPAPAAPVSAKRSPSAPSAPDTGPSKSHCTPIGPHANGMWAAELMPYSALVVHIPEGVELCLLRATLANDGGRAQPSKCAASAVRCRTPANKIPSTLCNLRPSDEETCALSALFSSRDRSCALAVEGSQSVHLIGCYTRSMPFDGTDSSSTPSWHLLRCNPQLMMRDGSHAARSPRSRRQ